MTATKTAGSPSVATVGLKQLASCCEQSASIASAPGKFVRAFVVTFHAGGKGMGQQTLTAETQTAPGVPLMFGEFIALQDVLRQIMEENHAMILGAVEVCGDTSEEAQLGLVPECCRPAARDALDQAKAAAAEARKSLN